MSKTKKRIPKTIAGVKLPKELRRAGETLIDNAVRHANSPQGKAMLATGLSMAAAAVTAAAERQRGKAADAHAARAPANDGEPPRPGQGGTAGDMVGEALEQAFSRLFGKR